MVGYKDHIRVVLKHEKTDNRGTTTEEMVVTGVPTRAGVKLTVGWEFRIIGWGWDHK